MRIRAAIGAVVVSLMLFAAAIAAASWMMSASAIPWVPRNGHFAAIVTIYFSMFVSVAGVWVIIFASTKKAPPEEDEAPRPTPHRWTRLKQDRDF
jgi:hypothetical protein